MIDEIGHYALVLALALALVQSVLPLWGARTGEVIATRTGECRLYQVTASRKGIRSSVWAVTSRRGGARTDFAARR